VGRAVSFGLGILLLPLWSDLDCLTESLEKKSREEHARIFVEYCVSTSEMELELDAELTGVEDVRAFIEQVKSWKPTPSRSSLYSRSAACLPRVPYVSDAKTLPQFLYITSKNRQKNQLTTMQVYDNYTVSKRAAFVSQEWSLFLSRVLSSD
jgi:hypothetical protein